MPVNTSHSIGQYARVVLRESESHNEILNGTVPSAGGTTATVAGKLAFVPDTNYTTWARNTPDLDPVTGGSFTVFWHGESVLLAACLLAAYTNGYGWRFELQGWDGGQSELWLVNHFTGNKTTVRFSNSNTVRSFAVRFDASDNTIDFCVDGTWVATNLAFNPGTNAVQSTGNFTVQNSSGTFSQRSKIITSQAFAGYLSDADVAVLMADPEAIFAASAIELTGAGSTQGNTSSTAAIGITGELNGAASVQANAAPGAALTQTHSLAGAASVQGNFTATGTINPYVRLRALLDPLPLHTWVKANLNSFDDCNVPSSDREVDPGNHRSIISAWSSFAWDHAKGNLVLFGGGHANYTGNELYIWSGSTGLWELGSLPSKIDLADTALLPVISKDAPQSSHTYQNNVWLKNNRAFVTFGGAAAPSGGTFQELVTASPRVIRRVAPWVFDLDKADSNRVGGATGTGWDTVDVKQGSNAWQHRRDMVDGTYPIDTANHVNGAAVAVDEGGTDVVYLTMDNASNLPSWFRYEFGDIRAGERDTCAQVGARISNSNVADGWMAYDTTRGFLYRNGAAVSGYTSEIAAIRPATAVWNTPDTPINVVDELGDPFSMNIEPWPSCFFGCVYDEINDGLWLWDAGIEDATKPGRVWFINIPAWDAGTGWASTTWVATEINPTGDTPFGGHSAGVLGKVKHVPEVGAFVVLDGAGGATDPGVWFFKTTELSLNLGGAASSQANTSSTAALQQTQSLAAAASSVASTSSTAALEQTHSLAGAASSVANSSSTGELAQNGTLVGAASSVANSSSTAALTQTHSLAAAASSVASTSSSGALSLDGSLFLAGAASSVASVASTAALTQTHSLIAAASIQDNIAAASPLVQAHFLAGAASSVANTSSTGTASAVVTVPAPAGSGPNLNQTRRPYIRYSRPWHTG